MQNRITAEAVFDAHATSGTTGLSLTVDGDGPTIIIDHPRNITYRHPPIGMDIRVNDSANVSAAYYSVNSTVNQTLTLDQNGHNHTDLFLPFNATHTLFVYANDTLRNLNVRNVTFTINASIIYEINWSKFMYPGSTNLTLITTAELENLSNFTLRIPQFGGISFNETVNLSDDLDNTGPLNFDVHVTIASNFIFINSTIMRNLNKSATLTLSNLTFSNPNILRDGAACPAAICTKLSYTNNDLIFSVTGFSGFSSYEAEEGSGGGGSSGGGGGGSGGGGGAGSIRSTARHILGFLNELTRLTVQQKTRVFFTTLIDGQPLDHSLTIMNLDRGTGTLHLRIDSLRIITDSLTLGQQQFYDLDSDGQSDIVILFESIDRNDIILLLGPYQSEDQPSLDATKKISEERPRQLVPAPLDHFFSPEDEGRNAVYLIVFMSAVVCAISFVEYVLYHRKKALKSRYRRHKR